MKEKIIREHPLDYEFRKYTRELIELAKDEIHIVTGEFSIYYFDDVAQTLRNAIRKGVSIKAYLGVCDDDTINRVVTHGITVYAGKKRPDEHYIIADRKHWIKSEKHVPYSIGKRHGVFMKNDEKGAADKIKIFEYWVDKIKPITKPDTSRKSLLEITGKLYQ